MAEVAEEIAPPLVKRTTLIVRDIETSRRFYRDVLGMTVWFDRPFELSGAGFPGTKKGDMTHLVIMQARDPKIGMIGLLQFTDPPLEAPPPAQRIAIGGAIFVMDLDDVAGLYRRLQDWGAEIAAPPSLFEVVGATGKLQRYTRTCFFDPDGYFFEASEPLPD